MRYWIRQQKKYVSGPHEIEFVRQWIQEGKVREDMEFSEDRQEWLYGLEMPHLFPRRSPRPRRSRRRRTR